MSQIDFFINENERIEFIKYCFKQNCKIIPDLHYNSINYITITNINEYVQYCKKIPLLFIVSKTYTHYPLELNFINEGNKTKYFINQRHGGPTIDFFTPVVGEQEEGILGPGYLGLYPFYYYDNKKFVPNKDFISHYKLFANYIKSISKRVKLSQRTFWVGKETIEKAKSGEIKLLSISNINLLELL